MKKILFSFLSVYYKKEMLYDHLEEIYPTLLKLFGVDTLYCILVNHIVHKKGNVHSISVFKGFHVHVFFVLGCTL